MHRIHSGGLVDRYLATEGALAQAFNRSTVLLHSSVFAMSAADRLLLVLHEFAHLEQLAAPGGDPVRALEEEAWDAAHAWAAGRSYRIRGRARGQLNALAIIQGGEKEHPSAPGWYGSSPLEPIGNKKSIAVKSVVVVPDLTLESLMKTIIDAKEKEVVVVCHGFGDGLAIQLISGQGMSSKAQKENIFVLAADRSFDEGGAKTPIRSVKALFDQTHLPEDRLVGLRKQMNDVRALKLEHVAFRACDMASGGTDGLQAFRHLFGAKSVSGPKIQDTYGSFSPTFLQTTGERARAAEMAKWVEAKRKDHYHVWVDRKVGFGTKDAGTWQYQIASTAYDEGAFAGWLKAHISDRAGSDGNVVYHGMMLPRERIAGKDATSVYFIRDDNFLANLVYYDG